jgi:hypothetical protein
MNFNAVIDDGLCQTPPIEHKNYSDHTQNSVSHQEE